MKTLLALAILTLPCSSYGMSIGKDWNKKDTIFQGAFTALHLADWSQTIHISNNPDKFMEINGYLGRHPGREGIHRYMGSILIAHSAISYLLPRKWRNGWQFMTAGAKLTSVLRNYNIGIRFDF